MRDYARYDTEFHPLAANTGGNSLLESEEDNSVTEWFPSIVHSAVAFKKLAKVAVAQNLDQS